MSDEVSILTAEPLVIAPMVMPSIVTLNGVGEIVAPTMVMISEVAVVGPHAAERSATVLLPDEILGMTEVAKKDGG